MSTAPTPNQGRYLDSTGTRYTALHHKKTGWWIQKLLGNQPAYSKPDFPEAVRAGTFTYQPETR